MSSIEDLEAKNTSKDRCLAVKIFQEPRSQPNVVEEETTKTATITSGGDRDHPNIPAEHLEPKNGLQDPDLPYKKGRTYQEPRSITPNMKD